MGTATATTTTTTTTAAAKVWTLITAVSQYSGVVMILTGGVCRPKTGSLSYHHAIYYCLFLSAAFAGSLYVLVPRKIRKLDRDDPRQIKWRILATGMVCMATASLHRYLFCSNSSSSPLDVDGDGGFNKERILSLLISSVTQMTITSSGVLLHLVVLYVGHILATSLEISLLLSSSEDDDDDNNNNENKPGVISMRHLWDGIHAIYFGPLYNALRHGGGSARWICLRNLVVAPFAEELVFRAHMVPVLQSSTDVTLSVWQLCRIAPLFFGIAHAHHAFRRLQQKESLTLVVYQTLFQFVYTTIFGAYATYVYIQTGSLCAISVAHSFCNWMGLPCFAFLRQSSSVYGHRRVLLTAYMVGIAIFAVEFKYGIFMPSSSSPVQQRI
jgi:prenyl protein peptidase